MGIVAHELSKQFGDDVEAVAALSLEIRRGEVYGLIGPNGAGKTTALRMLAGLMLPTSGRAAICGFDVVGEEAAAKDSLGFLTGTTGLYARLTPRELLVYFGRLYGQAAAVARARTAELAELLQFVPQLDRRCDALSTGQRQRVSLARAMIHDPQVLILDEPTAGLDVLASRFVADFIRSARARDRAILFSTHYMTEAELLCDRIGLLHRGRLLREGTPAALRAELDARSLEEAFLRLIDQQEQRS